MTLFKTNHQIANALFYYVISEHLPRKLLNPGRHQPPTDEDALRRPTKPRDKHKHTASITQGEDGF